MNVFQWPSKFADEVLDYEVDWNAELEEGETISGEPEVIVTGNVAVDTQSTADGVTRLRLSGGDNMGAVLNILATTSSGQKVGARCIVPISSR